MDKLVSVLIVAKLFFTNLNDGQKTGKLLFRISVDDLLDGHLLNVRGLVGVFAVCVDVGPEEKLLRRNRVSSLSTTHVLVNFWDRDLKSIFIIMKFKKYRNIYFEYNWPELLKNSINSFNEIVRNLVMENRR